MVVIILFVHSPNSHFIGYLLILRSLISDCCVSSLLVCTSGWPNKTCIRHVPLHMQGFHVCNWVFLDFIDPVLEAAWAGSSSGQSEDGGTAANSQGIWTPAQHPIPRRCSGLQQRRHWAALTPHHRHYQETPYGWFSNHGCSCSFMSLLKTVVGVL